MSNIITFDITQFRAQCPEFENETTYPDAFLQGYWDIAICYISDVNYGYLRGDCRQRAINYMVAHLLKLSQMIAMNQTPGQIQGSSIDKISVTMTPPPNKTQFQWWLGTTAYGQLCFALLGVHSTGGFYVGGKPELAAFRKVGGIV
jgi:hypothetical protein